MRLFNVLVLSILLSVMVGCAQSVPKAATANDAIKQSESLPSIEEKAKYMISQANAFVNSKNFEEAISAAQYVLSKLDSNSQEAKSILETAKEELAKLAQQKIDEAKTEASKSVGDMKKKLGALGQ